MQVKKGFTLIELSLSLVFIGVLSLTIAFIINDTVASYRRGLTLGQINTGGMDLVDDIRTAVGNSSTKPVTESCYRLYAGASDVNARNKCRNNNASKLVSNVAAGNVTLKNGKVLKNVPLYGVFCTGSFSYIWNSGYFFNNEQKVSVEALKFKYKNESNNTATYPEPFRLLKIRDGMRNVCASVAGYSADAKWDEAIDISKIDGAMVTEEPIDLLRTDGGSDGLALYNMSVFGPVESAQGDLLKNNSLFYSMSFILGTVQGGADIMKSGGYCVAPKESGSENFDYCAINKFNFAVMANGE